MTYIDGIRLKKHWQHQQQPQQQPVAPAPVAAPPPPCGSKEVLETQQIEHWEKQATQASPGNPPGSHTIQAAIDAEVARLMEQMQAEKPDSWSLCIDIADQFERSIFVNYRIDPFTVSAVVCFNSMLFFDPRSGDNPSSNDHRLISTKEYLNLRQQGLCYDSPFAVTINSAHLPLLRPSSQSGFNFAMGSSTFHPFSSLPVELRLQIWQDACRLNLYGIQYITLDQNNQLALPTCYNGDTQASSNRSAYLQNAGLWTACKEFRSVIAGAWNMPKWNWLDYCCQTKYDRPFDDPTDTDAPAMVKIPEDPWHVAFCPARDIFCITADDDLWKQWLLRWKWSELTAIFLGKDSVMPDANVIPVTHIALEYSPSWNKILKHSDPGQHPSGLEFLIQMLCHLSREKPLLSDNVVYLIDKTAR
ncbi:hypothetical protein F53441_8336 [Fusarium austroafricanum]|uniref:2EXR domain-containing protein n=1 Tax=Fusarium austroafricanum TaxID=2364996 RepID=A0A8H4NRA5_9HYPO|nr:hypothetical protein F53441_8336 [Fusarium austroafricanum]